MTKVGRVRRNKNYEIENDHLLDLVMMKIMNPAIPGENEYEGPKLLTIYKEWEIRLSPRYEGSLKTAIKKVVLKYNDGNENTDYSKNKNYRSTSSQKSVLADDEELDESDESDKSDESDE
ncbi:hypothetical protein C1645_838406 [Glomus cerebriforme]|uniref:Uncharacterized protein n=1 Tax=Glomus cerebriforme TaxID=658196 RepID=A0A397S2H1_9GLOM|nr:hypothetical protein C1645_838406 [Glomus cerebriforme]